MREVTTVEPQWLVELAPQFFRTVDRRERQKGKKKERIVPLYNKYAEEWRPSKTKKLKKR